MDYKEKYNAALRRAKKLYGEGTITECLGWVFPELEDEDERIKREILELVSISSNGNQFEEIKDWLEKQGEQPTDKLEPKFKVGDWIILPLGIIAHIDSLNSTDYQVTTTDGKICDFKISKQDNYRIWTIADAMDGDVLYSPCLSLLWIFKSKDTIYCGCNLNYNDCAFCGEGYFERPTDAIPATKEQRDAIERAMTNAGYEWDGDKKELKKIEVISKESEDEQIKRELRNDLILYVPTPERYIAWLEKQGNMIDPDKVVEWLECKAFQGWAEPIDIRPIIRKFKKDFGL